MHAMKRRNQTLGCLGMYPGSLVRLTFLLALKSQLNVPVDLIT